MPHSPQNPQNEDEEQESVSRFHFRQLALQCAAAFVVLSLAWPFFIVRNEPLPWPATALAIGSVAFILASMTRQVWWWRAIHALFAPLAWYANTFSIDPGWYLFALILLLLVYRGALTGQIPLYLSNTGTAEAIVEITAKRPAMRLLDLGAGIGSVLAPLAKIRPDAEFTGIENAPITWFAGYLRTMGLKNCQWRWGNLWDSNFGNFDVVYAFLSPTPMPEIWKKVEREMQPGSIFISNSFPVPGVEPTHVIEVADTRRTRLYCYQRPTTT